MNSLALGGLLGNLPFAAGSVTRQINAENPTGQKGAACQWDPDPNNPLTPHSAAATDLGRGWKVRPFIQLKAGQTATLADIAGPGCVNYFWISSDLPEFRSLVLRIYWDNETTPSVECPLGDFFAMGHDAAPHTVNSLPVCVNPFRGMVCYWQMPFRKSGRFTLENQSHRDANIIGYKILYKLHDIPADAAYLHGQWRRSITQRNHPEHTILDAVTGKGAYVGTYLAWSAFSHGWWGEGEVKFYIDGDKEFPTISDNGTEDYFGGAWCFYKGHHSDPANRVEQIYNTPFAGMPLAHINDPQGPRLFSLYRWHLLDSIGFAQNLRVTVQALGWFPEHKYEPLTDDIASTAFWYQLEPHAPFPILPPISARWSR